MLTVKRPFAAPYPAQDRKPSLEAACAGRPDAMNWLTGMGNR